MAKKYDSKLHVEFRKGVWEIANSNLILLILGFIITIYVGNIVAQHWQLESWKQQEKLNNLRANLDSGQAAIEEMSDLMFGRFYPFFQIASAYRDGDAARAEALWPDYESGVSAWNKNFIKPYYALKVFLDDDLATRVSSTALPGEDRAPGIRQLFAEAHRDMLALRACADGKSAAALRRACGEDADAAYQQAMALQARIHAFWGHAQIVLREGRKTITREVSAGNTADYVLERVQQDLDVMNYVLELAGTASQDGGGDAPAAEGGTVPDTGPDTAPDAAAN